MGYSRRKSPWASLSSLVLTSIPDPKSKGKEGSGIVRTKKRRVISPGVTAPGVSLVITVHPLVVNSYKKSLAVTRHLMALRVHDDGRLLAVTGNDFFSSIRPSGRLFSLLQAPMKTKGLEGREKRMEEEIICNRWKDLADECRLEPNARSFLLWISSLTACGPEGPTIR